LRRVLEAVESDVEVAALERRHQIRPVVLNEPRLHAEPARDRLRDVDLEADDLRRIVRILVKVRLAALQIGAPGQLVTLLDRGERAAVIVGTARSGQRYEKSRALHARSMPKLLREQRVWVPLL